MVSWGSPMKPEISAAASSTMIMKSENCPSRMAGRVRRFFSGMLFGPYSARRCCASAVVSPAGEDARRCNASSASMLCQDSGCTLLPGEQVNEQRGYHGDQQRIDPAAQPRDACDVAKVHAQQEDQQQRDNDGDMERLQGQRDAGIGQP